MSGMASSGRGDQTCRFSGSYLRQREHHGVRQRTGYALNNGTGRRRTLLHAGGVHGDDFPVAGHRSMNEAMKEDLSRMWQIECAVAGPRNGCAKELLILNRKVVWGFTNYHVDPKHPKRLINEWFDKSARPVKTTMEFGDRIPAEHRHDRASAGARLRHATSRPERNPLPSVGLTDASMPGGTESGLRRKAELPSPEKHDLEKKRRVA